MEECLYDKLVKSVDKHPSQMMHERFASPGMKEWMRTLCDILDNELKRLEDLIRGDGK